VKYLYSLLAVVVLACAGCGAVLPKPDTAKQAGIEALVGYGLAAHVTAQYVSAPVCTAPVTVIPCKNPAVAQQLKSFDNSAYTAAMAVHEAVNNPQFDKSKLDTISVVAAEALKVLNAYIASQAVQSTLGGK
jgi:hypothetical protein